jgi:hypothetical protein
MKKTIASIASIITVLFIFVSLSYAQSHNNYGWHGAIANLVAKENTAKEQIATAKKKEEIASEIKVAHSERTYLSTSEIANSVEKTDRVEH